MDYITKRFLVIQKYVDTTFIMCITQIGLQNIFYTRYIHLLSLYDPLIILFNTRPTSDDNMHVSHVNVLLLDRWSNRRFEYFIKKLGRRARRRDAPRRAATYENFQCRASTGVIFSRRRLCFNLLTFHDHIRTPPSHRHTLRVT